MPQPVVRRVVERAVLEGQVMDREDIRHAGGHRHGSRGGQPDHVGAGGEPVEARPAGERRGHEPHAARIDELVFVLREEPGQLLEHGAQVAGHAAGARRARPQRPAVDGYAHAPDCYQTRRGS
jgi:hypothetical protein